VDSNQTWILRSAWQRLVTVVCWLYVSKRRGAREASVSSLTRASGHLGRKYGFPSPGAIPHGSPWPGGGRMRTPGRFEKKSRFKRRSAQPVRLHSSHRKHVAASKACCRAHKECSHRSGCIYIGQNAQKMSDEKSSSQKDKQKARTGGCHLTFLVARPKQKGSFRHLRKAASTCGYYTNIK
jgi:hypothetical protein